VPSLDRKLAFALALPVFVAALLWGRSSGRATARTDPAPGAVTARTSAAAAPVAAPRVLVDVVGAVRHPAVYRLAHDARVLDAVRAAGGATRAADIAAVNLAAPIADGEQIVVPARSAMHPAAGTSTGTAGGARAPLHLNVADATALDALPGVGPATATRIVAWRTAHGPFRRLDDLLDVPGIGPVRLAALQGLAAP